MQLMTTDGNQGALPQTNQPLGTEICVCVRGELLVAGGLDAAAGRGRACLWGRGCGFGYWGKWGRGGVRMYEDTFIFS